MISLCMTSPRFHGNKRWQALVTDLRLATATFLSIVRTMTWCICLVGDR